MPLADCVCCDPCKLSCNGTGELPAILHAVIPAPAFGEASLLNGAPYNAMIGSYTLLPIGGFPGNWRYDGPPANGSYPGQLDRLLISFACKKVITVPPFGLPYFRFAFFVQGLSTPSNFLYNFQDREDSTGSPPYPTETFVSCSPPDIRYHMVRRTGPFAGQGYNANIVL